MKDRSQIAAGSHPRSARGNHPVPHPPAQGRSVALELSPETGRTHQIRVQVTAAGRRSRVTACTVDRPLHGLMLHADPSSIADHSGVRARRSKSAPLCPSNSTGGSKSRTPTRSRTHLLFDARLRQALDARWALGTLADTSAFRILHGEGEGVRGVAIDAYDEHLLVHFFSEEALARKDMVFDRAFELGVRGIYSMAHPKQSNTLIDPRKESLAPSLPVRGEAAPSPLVIRELGLAYRVRLGDGLKTGIFLDQRETAGGFASFRAVSRS